jgi:hypothetical protein
MGRDTLALAEQPAEPGCAVWLTVNPFASFRFTEDLEERSCLLRIRHKPLLIASLCSIADL